MVANEILFKLLSWANQALPDHPDQPERQPFYEPEKLLIIPSKFIGDNILLTPFIRNLRRNLPAARIDMVTTRALYPLYETCPHLDSVFMEKDGATKKPAAFLRKQDYDTIFLCRYSLYWGRAATRARLHQRVGFDLERLGLQGLKHWGDCLTHASPSRSVFDTRPQVETYLSMLRELGFSITDDHLECHLTDSDRARAKNMLARFPVERPKILVHAASGSPGKRWAHDHWQTLLRELQVRYNPVFLATGHIREKEIYRPWESEFELVNLCGETTLRETVALLGHMDLVITLDTSVAHLAALAGTPRLIVLYGPTNELQWRPWVRPDTFLAQVHLDLPCRPCMARTCEHRSCIRRLTPEQVLEAVETAFRNRPYMP